MYEIIIKKKEVVTVVENGEHQVISERGPEECELKQAKKYDCDVDTVAKKKYNVYGMVPSFEKKVEKETELLRQTVDTLDLVSVIKAINGID